MGEAGQLELALSWSRLYFVIFESIIDSGKAGYIDRKLHHRNHRRKPQTLKIRWKAAVNRNGSSPHWLVSHTRRLVLMHRKTAVKLASSSGKLVLETRDHD